MLFGGKNDGRVLLSTFWSAVGPIDRVGLWPGAKFVGEVGTCKDEDGGKGGGERAGDELEDAGAEWGVCGPWSVSKAGKTICTSDNVPADVSATRVEGDFEMSM